MLCQNLQALLDSYQQLRNYCDQFFRRCTESFPAAFSCSRGCSACCRLETVTALEAFYLGAFLADQTSAAPASAAPADMCPFLDDDLCRVYDARPVICQTHGLALTGMDMSDGEVDCCPLNFPDGIPENFDQTHVLNVDEITENLMRLNLAFCMIVGNRKLAGLRLPLEDVINGRLPPELLAARREC